MNNKATTAVLIKLFDSVKTFSKKLIYAIKFLYRLIFDSQQQPMQ